jgi:hypothetical protein
LARAPILSLSTQNALSSVADSIITTLGSDARLAMSEWVRCFDEASGTWFFFNQVSNATQWDEPKGFSSGGVSGFGGGGGDDDGSGGGDNDDPWVAVIMEYKPLCARCFNKKRPLRRSKSFLCVFFLALVGLLAAFVLSNSDCPTVTERSDDVMESTALVTATSLLARDVTMVSDVDLVFLYDKSGSMSVANVLVEQDFVEGMVRAFNATLGGRGRLHAGVSSYECAPLLEAALSGDLESVIAATHASGTSRGGCTRTDRALGAFQDAVSGTNPAARPAAVKVCVVLSDGSVYPAEYWPVALAAAQAVKGANQTVMGVYINDSPSVASQTEMWRLSSCAPTGTEPLTPAAKANCSLYFDGTFAQLAAAASAIAEAVATSVGSTTSSVTTSAEETSSQVLLTWTAPHSLRLR